MLFNIVSPIVMEIDGNDYKDAVKNFIKLNYALNLQRIIFHDQSRHYRRADFNYYNQYRKKKVGIDIYPVPGIYMN
tara:strand:- start:7236 stop:7463 length:228 start_codon:yes stop_codon:yes gene_type:complete